jgi:hypothetical protein
METKISSKDSFKALIEESKIEDKIDSLSQVILDHGPLAMFEVENLILEKLEDIEMDNEEEIPFKRKAAIVRCLNTVAAKAVRDRRIFVCEGRKLNEGTNRRVTTYRAPEGSEILLPSIEDPMTKVDTVDALAFLEKQLAKYPSTLTLSKLAGRVKVMQNPYISTLDGPIPVI